MNNSVSKRREKVSNYLIKGLSEKQISQILKKSRQTIVRDVKFMKDSAQNWLTGLAKNGYVFEYKSCLDKVKTRERKLEELIEKESDPMKIAKLISTQNSCTKLYADLLDAAPTINAIKNMREEDDSI